MTVACDVTTCGYNVDGICCQKCCVTLKGGHCSYLIKYPNSFTQRWDSQEIFEYTPATIISDDNKTPEALPEPNDKSVEKPKRKRGRPKKKHH